MYVSTYVRVRVYLRINVELLFKSCLTINHKLIGSTIVFRPEFMNGKRSIVVLTSELRGEQPSEFFSLPLWESNFGSSNSCVSLVHYYHCTNTALSEY